MKFRCDDVITLTEQIKKWKMTSSDEGMVCNVKKSINGKTIYMIFTKDMDMFNLNEDDTDGVKAIGSMYLADFLEEAMKERNKDED